MIFDCFTFFNELELLDIRLHELDKIVSKFVLVESNVTFTNRKKVLYYDKHKELFKNFEKKIIHIVVKDSPKSKDPWEIERFQFNAIRRGLKTAKSDDVILLSCIDEIPKIKKVEKWISKKPQMVKIFLQKLSYYYLNNIVVNSGYWKGTRMMKYSIISKLTDLYSIRSNDRGIKVKDGGWHFSYIGGVKKIQQKIKAFSHQEFNQHKYASVSNIKLSLYNRTDLFDRKLKFKIAEHQVLPAYIQKNKKKFSKLLLPEESNLIIRLTKKLGL